MDNKELVEKLIIASFWTGYYSGKENANSHEAAMTKRIALKKEVLLRLNHPRKKGTV